jgi:Pentapeptide repeats (9 copies)
VNDHPDLEKLDPRVREIVREVFRDPANGTPDNISKAGCLALATKGYEAWNDWRKNFKTKDLTPFNCVDFSHTDFRLLRNINFAKFEFGESANFSNCTFGFGVDFWGALFDRKANFYCCTFGQNASFFAAYFGYGVNFIGCDFHGAASFQGAIFDRWADFSGAYFNGSVDFSAMEWGELKNFLGEYFVDRKALAESFALSPLTFKAIRFSGVSFKSYAKFNGRKFLGNTNFGTPEFDGEPFSNKIPIRNQDGILVRDKLTGKVQEESLYLENSHTTNVITRFFVAPTFYDCELSQNISFENVAFPMPKGAFEDARAYRALKLSFSKQQAAREEQRFFKLEMAEDAARTSDWRERILYKIYWTLSGYGLSITRPFYILLLTLLLSSIVYGAISWETNCLYNLCDFNSAWIEYSLLQSLPLPGLDKLSDAASITLFGKGFSSIWLTLTVILHKAVSLLALFLIGLGLRNLFKLK